MVQTTLLYYSFCYKNISFFLYLSFDKKIPRIPQSYKNFVQNRYLYKILARKLIEFFASNFQETQLVKKIHKYIAKRDFCNFRNILRSGFWGHSSLLLISLAKKYHEGFRFSISAWLKPKVSSGMINLYQKIT